MAKPAVTAGVPSCAVTPPVSVTVMDWAGELAPTTVEGKLAGLGVSESAAGASPDPVSEAVAGLPEKLPGRLSSPVRVPAAVGVNVTCTEHVPPAASEAAQVVEAMA